MLKAKDGVKVAYATRNTHSLLPPARVSQASKAASADEASLQLAIEDWEAAAAEISDELSAVLRYGIGRPRLLNLVATLRKEAQKAHAEVEFTRSATDDERALETMGAADIALREAKLADGLFSIALGSLHDSSDDVRGDGEADIEFGTHSPWASRLEGARVRFAAPSAKRALSAVLEPGPGKSEPTMTVRDGAMIVHADSSARAFTEDGRPIGPDGRPAERGVPLDDWALRRAQKDSLGPAARVCSSPSSRATAVASPLLAPSVAPTSTELPFKDVIDDETRAKGRAVRPARKAAKAQERAAQTAAAAAAAQRDREESRTAAAALTALRAEEAKDAEAERARAKLEVKRADRVAVKLQVKTKLKEENTAQRRAEKKRRRQKRRQSLRGFSPSLFLRLPLNLDFFRARRRRNFWTLVPARLS